MTETQPVYRIQTNPVLEFRRGSWGLPVPVRPMVLGEVRSGETIRVIDPQGNDYGEISVHGGQLFVGGAEHIVGYSGHLYPTADGAVTDGNVCLQHRHPHTSPESPPMIKIHKVR
ncbi:hypothetical protein A3B42_00570 [Candidatus Daviesbacteria bacterium RIFCSPLOWO2_01_FULL_38_10]|uniref:Uncharacterized protein n=1 Tax=Candidatus Daviesbacteria bacterium GW2011_GWF2_38_6 TaxID=1618432 RepID=A0A0G0KFJ7_9BACT|nr:MAG: hypothetical protein US80_C0005G0026 [Candidatus Daviesbacteria bacterium GW2011_GWA2_38_17]KKQ78418.1 MAG: hypothetical protein US99_C0022G0010 [Candidatus Daviesbacteria bacterium GW2011_GWF2_38_6]OGE27180.1 MAG: hypothetical protein A3D02_00820 [Candidatus Daviesbacteria bacterium RIFCSPHIGHO2_02_FULL_39_41]OGE40209.1 MAG: hypothetical protein A3B42_00570 [Candidatus Daviesbacteria bacterium RIFCSPLOWO2_01_FULL_38_10]OGE45233.1 MAG: hypothetical protein A3E67_01805 [Candidatus Davies